MDSVMKSIDDSRDAVIDYLSDIIRIPSIGPSNGGEGESKVADRLIGYLDGFDIERKDIRTDDGCVRSNIIARLPGKKKGTVWIVAHMDTVHPGDLALWDHPPFEPFVDDGMIYGLGAEDNGQGLVSGLLAASQFKDMQLNGRSIGLAFVADEETGSRYGIQYLLDNFDYFTRDDLIIVPDWGSPEGKMIDVAEKHILWLKFTVIGKQTHGATPQKGLNAFKISTFFLSDFLKRLSERYGKEDDLFRPSISTFEPTKRLANVENINTIPGMDEFYMDCRILPQYDTDEIVDFIGKITEEYSKTSGAKIKMEILQRTASGPSSSTGTREFSVLQDSIEYVTGKKTSEAGIGGGTCSNFFRLKGLDAYAWSSEGGSLHKPNEFVKIDNIITDAKVFAKIFCELCIR